jgi:WD40 repeat protein
MARIPLLALATCTLCGGFLIAAPPRPQPAPHDGPPGASEPVPTPAPEPESFQPLVRFGDARLRHPAPVESLALSADGSRLLTATAEGPVFRLWDTRAGRLLRAVRAEQELTWRMTVIALTPDARKALVIRHQDHQPARVTPWHEPALLDLATGTLVRWTAAARKTREYHPIIALGPDGTAVATLIGGQVRVWEPGTGRERVLGTIANPSMDSGCICFSPDGSQVAASRSAGTLFLAPVNGNGPLQRVALARETEQVFQVFWPRPDRVVALWRAGLVALDPTTGAVRAQARVFAGHLANLPRCAAGGGLIFGRDPSKPLGTFDLATLDPVPDRAYPCTPGDRFAVSADGRVLAIAREHAVHLFDAATGKPLHPELLRAPVEPLERLDISADGSCLLGCTRGSAFTLSLSDGRWLAELGSSSPLETRFAVSPDGRFAIGGRSKSAHGELIELRTGRAVPLPQVGTGPDAPRVVGFVGPSRLWLWNEAENEFVPLDLGTNRAGPEVPGFPLARAVAVAPDGSRLAAAGPAGLAVRDLRTNRRWVILDPTEKRQLVIRCGQAETADAPIRFSPCGRWLLVSTPHDLELWDVRNRPARVGRFESANLGVYRWRDGGFSPDGRFLAVAAPAPDGGTELCVWEIAAVEKVYRFRPARGVAGVAFTPDGNRLIISHTDTTLSAWDRSALEARLCGSSPVGDEWKVLGSRDAKLARAAVRSLIADPKRAMEVLAPWFESADARVLDQLIAELGAEEFRIRERAYRTLTALGPLAEPALLRAVTRAESPEVRARAEAILKVLGPAEGRFTGDRLRPIRAVEVLESIGSPDARALLARCAKAHPNTTLADEANSALARLAKK